MKKMHPVITLLLVLGLVGCSKSPSVVGPSGGTTTTTIPVPPPPPAPSIQGTVYDTVYRPLGSVKVEVVDGPSAGTSTISDTNGGFSLIGTFDADTTFRASKTGYSDSTGHAYISATYRGLTMVLELLAPPVSIAGDYDFTIVADSACRNFPDEFRTRNYTATIVSSSTRPTTEFVLTPGGATFIDDGYTTWVGVAGDYVVIGLGDGGQIFEEIAPNGYLMFEGTATASVSVSNPSTIAMAFDGQMEYCPVKSSGGGFPSCLGQRVVCGSRRMILTRR